MGKAIGYKLSNPGIKVFFRIVKDCSGLLKVLKDPLINMLIALFFQIDIIFLFSCASIDVELLMSYLLISLIGKQFIVLSKQLLIHTIF